MKGEELVGEISYANVSAPFGHLASFCAGMDGTWLQRGEIGLVSGHAKRETILTGM